MDDISKLLMNSSKGELLDLLADELGTADKVVLIMIGDGEDGEYTSRVLTLGLCNPYEAYGILDVAKRNLQDDEEYREEYR